MRVVGRVAAVVAVVLFLAIGLHGRVAKALEKVTVSVSDNGLAWIRRTACSLAAGGLLRRSGLLRISAGSGLSLAALLLDLDSVLRGGWTQQGGALAACCPDLQEGSAGFGLDCAAVGVEEQICCRGRAADLDLLRQQERRSTVGCWWIRCHGDGQLQALVAGHGLLVVPPAREEKGAVKRGRWECCRPWRREQSQVEKERVRLLCLGIGD